MKSAAKNLCSSLLLTGWLCVYNQLLGLGWLYVLVCMTGKLLTNGYKSFDTTWDELGWLVWRLQMLNLWDVVHAVCGLWPSEPEISLWQRLWCKCGHRCETFITIFLAGERMQPRWLFGPMVLTWAMADVTRYQLYFFRTLNLTPPGWMRWIRYSDFVVQWPLNVIAESAFVFSCIPYFIPWDPESDANNLDGVRFIQERGSELLLTYAPVAVINQFILWYEFPSGYPALWRIRTRRLHSARAQIDSCCAIASRQRQETRK
mmetsp:Transcript_13164/g.26306  ORF Transcript_13164/g.26306 Transcript_13164/m.26306 type:complete len:261 (+) Transcript_13164:74-856(+)